MHHSPCSQVATPSPNPTGGTKWLGGTSACGNPCARSFNSYGGRGGADGRNLLWAFFSRPVQPLHQWVTTMWMYPGPSYPDRPFSEELDYVEINTWIHRVLAHMVDLSTGAGPTPLTEACLHSPLVFAQFDLLMVLMSAHRISWMLVVRHGGSPYLMTRRGGKQTAPTMNGCGSGDRESGPRVLPGWR
jgi:hypothetical protein